MSKVKIVSYRKHTPADASCFTCAEGSLYRVRSFGVQCSNVGKWHCANTTTLICRSLIFLIFSDLQRAGLKCPLGYAAYVPYYVCQIIYPLPLHPLL